MASSQCPIDRNFIVVDFHYNGTFAPNPLVYFDPDKQSVGDVDFSAFEYEEFMEFLQKLTRTRSKDIYFCLPQESLSQGIHTLVNDGDYKEFLDLAYANERRMNVYVDHYNEPIFEWIEEEEIEDQDYSCEEDEDSVFSETYSVDHEEDDVEYPFPANKTKGDRFLNKLCVDTLDEDVEYLEPRYPVHDDRQPWNQMKPLLGMRFSNPDELKNMLSNYAVANGYDLWFEKNDSQRLLVKCCKENKSPNCPFRLWASWMSKERTFQIKSLVSEHNCSRVFKFGSIVTYKWLGKQFMSEIIEKPKMSVRKMKAKVSTTFNINVSEGQCRNAKKFALQEIEGSLIEHYGRLWSYGHEILRTNPGSTVRMDVDIMQDSTTLFSKYYVCFKAISDGWKEGCRPVIGLDDCFLKGIVRGEVLAAVGRDANNQIYPIAWAVVGVENKTTWKWFIDLLMDDIDGGLGAGITLFSDGHKGLLEAVKERCPEAEHRQCARHIVANFAKRFTGQHFRKLFWRAVRASTEQKFKHVMEKIKSLDTQAYEYLIDRDPTTWSKAFFKEGRDCDAVENGVSESFNSAIRHARRKPIITMLEEIRIFVMERIYSQRVEGIEWDLNICPSIRKRIQDLKVKQRLWGVTPCGYQKYEVRFNDAAYGVDLIAKTCACRIWQLTGIPCLHGVAAISSLNQDAETYVSQSYSKEAFLKCYNYSINPLNGSDMWEEVPYRKPLPPKRRRLPGRPSMKRKRDAVERELSGPHQVHPGIVEQDQVNHQVHQGVVE
ncbi:uncharacterized protein LOC111893335 [Lactuca sativa]|uniref:uncharacterized protein LOC111893335 n=1 Tax=Lactuca sativa TaxID=4236 RepID=UPI0022AEC085|nr:uncharacterized protein LOC111893335 [Lactuca sativa]